MGRRLVWRRVVEEGEGGCWSRVMEYCSGGGGG